jgi:hypothetical protein
MSLDGLLFLDGNCFAATIFQKTEGHLPFIYKLACTAPEAVADHLP